MKKFLGVIFLVSLSICSFAQNPVASGTVTNTTYAYAQHVVTPSSGVNITGKVTYHIEATRTSGTTTGGIQLQYSNNATTWTAIPSADTLAIANAAGAQGKVITIDIPSAKYVRARAQLAGTGVYAFRLYASYRYNSRP